jgi:hypothetical protein
MLFDDGYADAATAVMNAAVAKNSESEQSLGIIFASSLVPPFLFLWRHHIELRLKEVLGLGYEKVEELELNELPPGTSKWEFATGQVLDYSTYNKVVRSHNLLQMWQLARPFIDWCWANKNDLKSMPLPKLHPDDARKLILKLHEVDPHGDGVRYTKTRKGRYTLGSLREIDLEHTDHTMRLISEFLSWVSWEVGREMRGVGALKLMFRGQDGD